MVTRFVLWLNDAVGGIKAIFFWCGLALLCAPLPFIPVWLSNWANWLGQVTFPLVLFSVVIYAQNYHSKRLDDLHDKHDALAETLNPSGDTLD